MKRCKYCQTMYSEGDTPEFKPECYEDVQEIDPEKMLGHARVYILNTGEYAQLETDAILLAAWRKVHYK